MLRIAGFLASLTVLLFVCRAPAQEPKALPLPDERYKADVLLVVAHPDDEAAVTPYLARAIYDEHKRVAVVFATRGGSGGNDYGREHGLALADVREQEGRQACTALGITNVWFLEGKDTASQNVMNSLANWGHGANLEALVRIMRLTRPEVILTWLPGLFIGENHGDHQASGVLATEAFDLAGEPASFPAQLASASKRLEPYLENLTPWQPKKLYFFSDADDQKQFAGTGPAYSVREISPSQKKPYWRIALEAAKPHLTQFPEDIQRLSKMSEDELNKMMSDPKAGWWTEPMTLIFGKSVVPAKASEDIFAATGSWPTNPPIVEVKDVPMSGGPFRQRLELAGVWEYYTHLRAVHHLSQLPTPALPEIGVKSGSVVTIPLRISRLAVGTEVITVSVDTPKGWRVVSGEGRITLPAESGDHFLVEVETPTLSAEELKKTPREAIVVRADLGGTSLGEVKLKVALQQGGLPQ